ncbi:hypothetical protein GCK72_015295 [Caenorhabditis remanei]|uniref:Uncharacterized protein n=1 Tax=Caenorhabditis remanei TaxID=31234 RepID=A0A6A5GWG6_CAERE|nr:hypothetical protein GCK72_015295 [Caenorhabditis remanei]KAF1758835.1 hypothetical protein GCK72_015295 [Caenorhabditis remanei]
MSQPLQRVNSCSEDELLSEFSNILMPTIASMGESQEISDTELSGQFEKRTVTGEEGENEQMQKLRSAINCHQDIFEALRDKIRSLKNRVFDLEYEAQEYRNEIRESC